MGLGGLGGSLPGPPHFSKLFSRRPRRTGNKATLATLATQSNTSLIREKLPPPEKTLHARLRQSASACAPGPHAASGRVTGAVA